MNCDASGEFNMMDIIHVVVIIDKVGRNSCTYLLINFFYFGTEFVCIQFLNLIFNTYC